MTSLKNMLDKAFSLSFSDLSEEFGLSYDEVVLLKSKSESHRRQKQNAQRAAKGPRPQIDKGTRNTRKNKTACPVHRLLKDGKITSYEYHSASRIEHGYRIKSKEVACKKMRFAEVVPTTGEGVSMVERDIENERKYNKWVTALSRTNINLNLVLDVIVHGRNLRVAEQAEGVRNGTASKQVVRSLQTYNRP
jgi:hypothetical protein